MVTQDHEICEHDLSVQIRSGASVVNVKPIFSYDSQYIIIACQLELKVILIKNGECLQTLRYHKKPIISIQANKSNHLQVFSCSNDGVVVRWDYIEGKILQVHKLKISVSNFYVPYASGPWFVTEESKGKHRLCSFSPVLKGKIKDLRCILKPVIPKDNCVDFDHEGTFCASISGHILTLYNFKTKKPRLHLTGERSLTCVMCHPKDAVVATGDNHGRVTIWVNALTSSQPIRSIYHWHTLPVADLAFTSEGSYLYSGGGEAVLVKWNLFAEERMFLPRMGAPIVYISTSKDNKYVITAHQDNTIQVIDSQRTVVQVIQGLTKGDLRSKVPTGLLYNPHMRAIVMNGKPGHLQFFDTEQDKQLFNLDIAGKNFLTQERDSSVFNIDVQKAAIDETGIWLATAEFWSNNDASPQIWLKFWLFDLEKQTFILNTNVILPHNKEINCIAFRPYPEPSASPLAITTSSDGRFKIWMLNDTTVSGKKTQSWNCESMGCYRELPAGSACFSQEGSVLAVAFEGAATLWDVEAVTLKAVLCNNKRTIKQLLFGRESCSHLLVAHDEMSITVWNVLTLSIIWIVHNEVQVLAVNGTSSVMAAFCKDQNLIIFTPDNPKPLRSFKKVSDRPIVSAIFQPFANTTQEQVSCFHTNSTLFFIDEEQTLYSVSENKIEAEKSTEKPVQNIVGTPYAMLQAERKVVHVEELEVKELEMPADFDEKSIISDPVLQNPIALCNAILPTMLRRLEIHEEEEIKTQVEQQDEEMPSVGRNKFISPYALTLEDFNFIPHSVVFAE